MPIFDGNLPYTNLHELNLDWVIKKLIETREYLDQVKAEVEHTEELLENLQSLADILVVSDNAVTISDKPLIVPSGIIANLTGNVIGNLTGTASNSTHADYADNATQAGSADIASNATFASRAANADHATTADTASIGVATGAEVFVTTPDSTRFPKGATSNMTVRVVKNDSTLAPDTGAWLLLDVSEPNNMAIGNPNGGVHRIAIPLDPNESLQEPTARRYIKCRPFRYTTSDRDTIQSISSWYNIWTDDSTPA